MKRPTMAEAEEAALRADSFSRLEVILRYRKKLPDLEWWRLLGKNWGCCDNVFEWRAELTDLMRWALRAHLDAMMTQEEHAALARLEVGFRVYRGCYQDNTHGLSWSLDEQVARRFPFLHRYHRPNMQPLLAIGDVERRLCVLKLDREELEIISPSVNVYSTEKLPKPVVLL